MAVEIGQKGQVARVLTLSDDRLAFSLEFRGSGMVSTATSDRAVEFEVGDVVLVADNSRLQKAPREIWKADDKVGVVKLRTDEETVVSAGSWRLIPTNEVPYSVGNTVVFDEQIGVLRVLDQKPLRFLDDDDGADVVTRFRVKPDASLSFADFGGLSEVVDRARELIELPLQKRAELAAIKAKAIKGVLFTGLPGTGKTMLAKIIANHADAKFYAISGPQVFSKYFGESEETLRSLFQDAAKQDRSVIFFDEIDSVAGRREGDSHEASRRVVAQLLTLMDGFKPDDNVVVIAATNRPQDIDVALLRPGRFDWTVEFPLPSLRDRVAILGIAAERHKTFGELPVTSVADATSGWSAAELTAIWSEAALLAVKDGRAAIAGEDLIGGLERVALHRKQEVTGESR